MDEWWRTEHKSISSVSFCFSLFISLIFFPFSSSPSPSLSLSLRLSLRHLCPAQSLSPGFSSWPSDTTSWCHFNNLRGEIGNAVSSQNWNGFFTVGCWYSAGRMREAASWIFFIKFVLGIILVNEEKWCDAEFPLWPRRLISLTSGGSSNPSVIQCNTCSVRWRSLEE